MLFVLSLNAQDELPPYFGVKVSSGMDELKTEIQNLIQENGFQVVGDYQVADNDQLWVVAFSSDELKKLCEDFEDRGALASVLKVGVRMTKEDTEVSLLNPNYMFYAYFGDDYKMHAKELDAISQKAKEMISATYGTMEGFGGGLSPEDLEDYHYKVMMPYFDDPVELESYNSFKEGLEFIRKKIAASGAALQLVYEVVNESKQTAVFGVGYTDAEKGEPHFLPIIGERHIAAMPYEIILQYDQVTMLAGKYRFALYWPELTMGEFMKIMSTPGDMEDAMESVTQKD
jgi:hypothetical protein